MSFSDTHRPLGSYSSPSSKRTVDLAVIGQAQPKIYAELLKAFKAGGGIIPSEKDGLLFTDPKTVAIHNIDRYRNVQENFRQTLQELSLNASLLVAAGGKIPTRYTTDHANTGLEAIEQGLNNARSRVSKLMREDLSLSPVAPHMHALMDKVAELTQRQLGGLRVG